MGTQIYMLRGINKISVLNILKPTRYIPLYSYSHIRRAHIKVNGFLGFIQKIKIFRATQLLLSIIILILNLPNLTALCPLIYIFACKTDP